MANLPLPAFGYGSAAPTSTSEFHLAGEIVVNVAPAAGEAAGWICTVEGYPGTWQPWAIVGQTTESTIAVSTTITSYYRYISVEAAGTVSLAATSGFPALTPISIRANASSLTLVPVAALIDGAAVVTLTAAQHVTIIHRGGTVWFSYGS